MKIIALGIKIAKTVFQLIGLDAKVHEVLSISPSKK